MKSIWPGWPNQAVFALLGILTIFVLLLGVSFQPPWPKVLETAVYLLGLLLLFTYRPMRSLIAAFSKKQLAGLIVLVSLQLFAQIRDRPQMTFPFIPWNMYHNRFPDQLEYLELVGVCPDGRQIEIPVGNVFASQKPRILLWRLLSLWKQSQTAKDESERLRSADQFRSLLRALVKRHQEQHPEMHFTEVRVIHCTLPRPTPGRAVEVIRNQLPDFALSSEKWT